MNFIDIHYQGYLSYCKLYIFKGKLKENLPFNAKVKSRPVQTTCER
jgi:hypothetical protein